MHFPERVWVQGSIPRVLDVYTLQPWNSKNVYPNSPVFQTITSNIYHGITLYPFIKISRVYILHNFGLPCAFFTEKKQICNPEERPPLLRSKHSSVMSKVNWRRPKQQSFLWQFIATKTSRRVGKAKKVVIVSFVGESGAQNGRNTQVSGFF